MKKIMSGVILSSGNISHYHHAARALHHAGLLKTYYTSFAPNRYMNIWSRVLPGDWKRKIVSRRLDDVDRSRIVEIKVPEIMARLLRRSRLFSAPDVDGFFSKKFDEATRRRVDQCQIFHFVNTLGLETAKKLKDRGAFLICDARTEHSDYQNRILRTEYEKRGLVYRAVDLPYQSRKIAEYGIADLIIVPSEYAARTFIEAGIPASKLRVVPYGVDIEKFSDITIDRDPQQESKPEFKIVYVGQLSIRKGVLYLLEAVQNLGIPNLKLIMAGGIEASSRKVIEPYLALPFVEYVGLLAQSSLVDIYRAGSVFVLPSLSDSYGLVTLEAMACGLPVIVSHNTGSKEAIRDGEDGFVIPVCKSEVIAEKLTWLFEHPDQRIEMGRSAWDRARRFSWKDYGDRLLSVYSDIHVQ